MQEFQPLESANRRQQPFLLTKSTEPTQAWVVVDGRSFVKFDGNFEFFRALVALLVTYYVLHLEYPTQLKWAFRLLDVHLLKVNSKKKPPQVMKYKNFEAFLGL